MIGPPEVTTVPQALGRLRVALDAAYSRASRKHGMTPQQAELLCAAFRPTPIGSLAHVLRCDQSNVTRLVDRAVKRNLIRRRPDREDGRVTLVELSPKGHKLAEGFIASLEAQTANLLAEWTPPRRSEVVAALLEIAETLDRPS